MMDCRRRRRFVYGGYFSTTCRDLHAAIAPVFMDLAEIGQFGSCTLQSHMLGYMLFTA
jgi:hypothetical protein